MIPEKDKKPIRIGNNREEELHLKFEREEIMNPYILTPHNELNDAIYASIDNYLERSKPSKLTVYIHTQKFSDILQEKIHEIYREHYSDDLREANKKRFYVILRFVILGIIAVILLAYPLRYLNTDESLSAVIMGSMGSYFLWKIGDIFFDWVAIKEKISLIKVALNAEINFQFHRPKAKKEE